MKLAYAYFLGEAVLLTLLHLEGVQMFNLLVIGCLLSVQAFSQLWFRGNVLWSTRLKSEIMACRFVWRIYSLTSVLTLLTTVLYVSRSVPK